MYKLYIDIDGRLSRELVKRINLLKLLGKVSVDLCKTNRGYHLRVYFDSPFELNGSDILFLQLFLMSDAYREFFNFLRLKLIGDAGNILFKKKYIKYGGRFVEKSKEKR
ncbi:MAG: hypothetical protein QXL14_02120 [Candidatus Aenigmatarchaeota archaeon]